MPHMNFLVAKFSVGRGCQGLTVDTMGDVGRYCLKVALYPPCACAMSHIQYHAMFIYMSNPFYGFRYRAQRVMQWPVAPRS